MTEARTFADVEALLVAALEAVLPSTSVVTRLPADLEAALPVARVAAVGGRDRGVTDTCRVDVDTFAADRPTSHDLAQACRATLHALRHTTTVDGWLVDRVITEVRPMWVDYQNDRVQRYVATYTVETRAHV